ncbi:MAG: 5-formyltetrahydrofolate cyclo-ligase [Ghiorsea sp.]
MTDISELKQKLRKYLSGQRKQLSFEERNTYSQQIISHLNEYLTSFMGSDEQMQILVYHALPVEVNTSALFEQSRHQIFVPRMLADQQMEWLEITKQTLWKQMDFGVLEPKQGNKWVKGHHKTVLIAPLLGFDRLGNRLGMGKGYFDRWLENHAAELDMQLGLAFSCQELPKVPVEPHDAPLATIITEHGVISCPTN